MALGLRYGVFAFQCLLGYSIFGVVVKNKRKEMTLHIRLHFGIENRRVRYEETYMGLDQ